MNEYYKATKQLLPNNSDPPKSHSFVKYSDKFEDVLSRALMAKNSSQKVQPPFRPFFIRVRSIGMGAFSTVYLVSEEKTKTVYALKVTSKSVVEANRESLEEELKIHMRLSHENIIKMYHAYREDDELRMVMQLAEDSLYNIMKKKGKLAEPEAATYIRQLLEALHYLHSHNITHRDIKLENLLILHGKLKLCDFGCAKRKKQFQNKQLVGTIDYLSPEVASDLPYNHKRDIWAAGVVLHQMLFGKPLMGDMKENQKYLYLLKFQPKQMNLPECSRDAKDFLRHIFQPQEERLDASALLQHPFLQQPM